VLWVNFVGRVLEIGAVLCRHGVCEHHVRDHPRREGHWSGEEPRREGLPRSEDLARWEIEPRRELKSLRDILRHGIRR
jgi:hypothetical protein